MHAVQITDPAAEDIQAIFTWWAENRSAEEAAVWYDKILQAMSTLSQMPERCPLVPETNLSLSGVRQLSFGVGRRPTHRIVFVSDEHAVSILRVRHHGQDVLQSEDLQ